MYTSVDFSSQILRGGGPLSHKQGGLIHQFGVWLVTLKLNYYYYIIIIYQDLGGIHGRPIYDHVERTLTHLCRYQKGWGTEGTPLSPR
jgi:hypothetical protein